MVPYLYLEYKFDSSSQSIAEFINSCNSCKLQDGIYKFSQWISYGMTHIHYSLKLLKLNSLLLNYEKNILGWIVIFVQTKVQNHFALK